MDLGFTISIARVPTVDVINIYVKLKIHSGMLEIDMSMLNAIV